jgi:hypothetical protein
MESSRQAFVFDFNYERAPYDQLPTPSYQGKNIRGMRQIAATYAAEIDQGRSMR